MTRTAIDLNSDMGEAYGAWRMGPDDELLEVVTSANVACGFHAGDPLTIDRTVAAACARGVAIGAHVSYPDLVGFGRRHLAVGHDELVADVVYQVGALDAFCRRHGTAVSYIKAHGALYNDLADDAELAGAFGDAIRAYGGDLAVLTLAGSRSVGVLRGAGLPVLREGFADRAYTPDGRLVPRGLPGAVVADPAVVADRGRRIATGEPIADCEGGEFVLEVDSLCVHGDTPGALELAVALRRALDDAGVAVARSR